MNDFVIVFGDGPCEDLPEMLRARPGVEGHRVEEHPFAWGRLILQPSTAPGYATLGTAGSVWACVGRARFVGEEHETRGDAGLMELVRERGLKASAAKLSGQYVIVEADERGVRILTDMMGFVPVFVGENRGTIAAVGTLVDPVAVAAGRETDFDATSLGELLVNNHVTFPYTTRRGVKELPPASLIEISADGRMKSEMLWAPTEPARWGKGFDAEFGEALRVAGEDVTRGVKRVAVMLSGGLDSRAVLGAVPREKRAGVVTYITRENREISVARRVAEAMGVEQRLAWRGEEFYAELMGRAVPLMGGELRADCHAFCLADNGLDDAYDMLLGGYLSDTFFKGHFMPNWAKEMHRNKSLKEQVRYLARRIGLLPPVRPWQAFREAAIRMGERMRPAVRGEMAERQRIRLEEVRKVRPETAEEWVRFWPASRHDDSYGTLVNGKLFVTDELFMHRGVVGLAARVPWAEKYDARLARRVFPKFYGAAAAIENANTGMHVGADEREVGREMARRRKEAVAASKGSGASPWNEVEDSWTNFEMMMRLSPAWRSYRRALDGSPAVEVWESVIDVDVMRKHVDAYQPDAGMLFNKMAVQLTWYMDRVLRRQSRPATAGAVISGSAA